MTTNRNACSRLTAARASVVGFARPQTQAAPALALTSMKRIGLGQEPPMT